jgi:branched-chain amino acid transport system permease protein
MNHLKNRGLWIALGLTLLIGLWPPLTGDANNREIVITILMYAALAGSLNLLLGYTGYVNFGHIVFWGLGAYVGLYAISVLNQPLHVAVLSGGLAAGLLALVTGQAILRLRGAYFALATIGINEAARAFVANFAPFGGPTGLSLNFKVYTAYGGALQALWIAYWAMFLLAIAAIVLSFAVKSSKFGLGLMAIRENEDAAEVMGVITPRVKVWVFVLSAIIPGMAGVIFFFKNGNIEPVDAFRLHTSIETIVMIMLGGQGTVLGPLLGAGAYERLRGLLLVSPFFKNIQLAVAGVFLLLIVLFIPSGVVGWLRRWVNVLSEVLE